MAPRGGRYHGLVVVRLEVADEGGVGRCAVLWDRVYPLTPDTPLFRMDDLTTVLRAQRFPAAPQPSRVTLPISIGTGLA